MLKAFLHCALYSPDDLTTSGAPPRGTPEVVRPVLFGAPYLLKARLRIILTDGGAWPLALQWSGAGCCASSVSMSVDQ